MHYFIQVSFAKWSQSWLSCKSIYLSVSSHAFLFFPRKPVLVVFLLACAPSGIPA